MADLIEHGTIVERMIRCRVQSIGSEPPRAADTGNGRQLHEASTHTGRSGRAFGTVSTDRGRQQQDRPLLASGAQVTARRRRRDAIGRRESQCENQRFDGVIGQCSARACHFHHQ